jgi:DNA-binding SARP family transcriptional activator
MEFRILGPLEVIDDDGRVVELGGPRQRALLAALLLRAGRVVPQDTLVDELWGEQPPRTAVTSLQNSVSLVRKALGGDLLRTRPPGYVLDVPAGAIDANGFERLVREAKGFDAQERARKLRNALALFRGPPLADVMDEPFAEVEARRLSELQLAAVEERIDADLELGRHAELVAELEALVTQHPLRERLRSQQMTALYRSGRQVEALAAYQDARRALVDELGIEPSPALQALERSILRHEGAIVAPVAPVQDHYGEVVKALLSGRLIPVIGIAGGISGRPDDEPWQRGATSAVPDVGDVASHLATLFDLPTGYARGLTSVSQYVAITQGIGPLYDELHAVFDADFAPGPVHRFLAELPAALAERGAPAPLVLTTHYDETLERALTETGVEYDVVAYIANGSHRGKFCHTRPDGSARVIDLPNAYADLVPGERTIVVKIHGQVDRRPEREWESFVVSEDDYIDYLAQAEIASLVPVMLAAKLRRSHFLFLGYALQEWNLRVFLHRIWGDRQVSYRSWSIQPQPGGLEREFWRKRGVDIYDVPLSDYVDELRARLRTAAVATAVE